MENNMKIELQLNEEQMQTVTGGCELCITGMKVVEDSRAHASHNMDLAAQAGMNKLKNQSDQQIQHYESMQTFFENRALAHLNAADSLEATIKARGHGYGG